MTNEQTHIESLQIEFICGILIYYRLKILIHSHINHQKNLVEKTNMIFSLPFTLKQPMKKYKIIRKLLQMY